MKRLLFTVLFVITLVTQWGLISHAYEEHDDEAVCEICVIANQHEDDHLLVSSVNYELLSSSHRPQSLSSEKSLLQQQSLYYSVRAPPAFSFLP